MNTGQVLLIIGALVILSFVTLAINSMLVSKTTTILQAEAHLTAISIAQSMIDEIMTAKYDSATVTKRKYPGQESQLTPYNYLGPETNTTPSEVSYVSLPEPPDTTSAYKSVTKYNDIDDYNNYKRYYFSPSMGTFTVVDTVFYITYAAPDQKSNTQTFFKKVVVTVRHPNFYPVDQIRTFDPWQGRYYLQLSDIAVYRRYF